MMKLIDFIEEYIIIGMIISMFIGGIVYTYSGDETLGWLAFGAVSVLYTVLYIMFDEPNG